MNTQNKTEYRTLTAVIPIAGAAGSGAGDRVATSEAQLAGFALDGDRTNDRGWFLVLFVCWSVASSGLARFATCTKLVKAQGTGAKVGALVETTFVADDFSGIESGTSPGRRLCGVAVEAAPAKVLGFLAGGVVCELNGDGSAGRRGKERGVVVSLEGVGGEAELGGDDEGGVLELDRLGVRSVGDGVGIGVLLKVLGLGDVVADVGKSGAPVHGVTVEVVLLLLLLPFRVVGAVVDVDVLGVVVLCVLFVELLEEGARLVCVGEPGWVVVDHQVRFLEDVGDRSDRDVVLWADIMKVGLVWGGGARCGRSVRKGRRGGIGVELHP